MRESEIERYLTKRVRETGGISYKWTSPNRRGVPDRILIYPEARYYLCELKATDKMPTQAQIREHRRLQAMGCIVLVIASKEDVDNFIKWYA